MVMKVRIFRAFFILIHRNEYHIEKMTIFDSSKTK